MSSPIALQESQTVLLTLPTGCSQTQRQTEEQAGNVIILPHTLAVNSTFVQDAYALSQSGSGPLVLACPTLDYQHVANLVTMHQLAARCEAFAAGRIHGEPSLHQCMIHTRAFTMLQEDAHCALFLGNDALLDTILDSLASEIYLAPSVRTLGCYIGSEWLLSERLLERLGQRLDLSHVGYWRNDLGHPRQYPVLWSLFKHAKQAELRTHAKDLQWLTEVPALTTLSLDSMGTSKLPLLPTVTHLSIVMEGCYGYGAMAATAASLPALRSLTVALCDCQGSLSKPFKAIADSCGDRLVSLRLEVSKKSRYCTSTWPPTAFPALQELSIEECRNLTELGEFLSELPNVHTLTIDKACETLEYTRWQCPQIKKLVLREAGPQDRAAYVLTRMFPELREVTIPDDVLCRALEEKCPLLETMTITSDKRVDLRVATSGPLRQLIFTQLSVREICSQFAPIGTVTHIVLHNTDTMGKPLSYWFQQLRGGYFPGLQTLTVGDATETASYS